jgi:hypothetical protein
MGSLQFDKFDMLNLLNMFQMFFPRKCSILIILLEKYLFINLAE